MGSVRKDRILCQTPTPDTKKTRIERWDYDLVRAAIPSTLPDDDERITFKVLPSLVETGLSREDRQRLGSIGWHTTTVKLDLEIRGETERVPGATPHRLRRVR